MSRNDFDVVVVGSGVAGLATALGCAQQGLRVALVGPEPRTVVDEPGFDARIYAIAPASVALLDRLGVWRSVDPSRIAPVERMRVFGDGGNELTFDAYGATVPELATIVEERELTRVLAAACGFQPSLARHASPLKVLEREAAGARIELEDGSTLAAQLVVGADGANSSVRAAAGISAVERRYGQRAVVANFACVQAHRNTAWQWFTDEGVVALLPLPGRHVSLVWSAPEALALEIQALDRDALSLRVTERSAAALGQLTAIGAAHSFVLRMLTVRHLVAPTVALVGDAAHVVHPLAGQGLNLGLQDVAELLDCIAARESHRALGDLVLLRRYERRRAEAISAMRWTTDGLQRLFAIDDPFVKGVRNAGLAVVNRLVPLKNMLIRRAIG
jgi:2-polyprenylphenol 6-hydroxylase